MRKSRTNCIDCGVQLGILSAYKDVKRCHSCNTKYLFKIGKLNQSGKNHSQYKKGLPKCLDCGKQLDNYGAKRCHSCCQKGILHPDSRREKNGMFGKKHNIETRAKISLSLGGTGIPYEDAKYDKSLFNDTLKESIRKRDNCICQNCSMTEEENIIVYGEILTIHHIDYDKTNCNENNLISVCHSCNTRANVNRTYWQEFYINKVNLIVEGDSFQPNAKDKAGKSKKIGEFPLTLN